MVALMKCRPSIKTFYIKVRVGIELDLLWWSRIRCHPRKMQENIDFERSSPNWFCHGVHIIFFDPRSNNRMVLLLKKMIIE